MVLFTAQAKQGTFSTPQPVNLQGLMVHRPQHAPRWQSVQLDDSQLDACYMTATVAEA